MNTAEYNNSLYEILPLWAVRNRYHVVLIASYAVDRTYYAKVDGTYYAKEMMSKSK